MHRRSRLRADFAAVACLIACLLVAGCDKFGKSPQSGANAPSSHPAGIPNDPNAVARAWVKAIQTVDPKSLTAISTEPSAGFYEACAEYLTLLDQLATAMSEMFPGEETARIAAKLRSDSRKPMAAYSNLKLEGKISGRPEDGKVVYLVSYDHYSGRHLEQDLIVEKVGDLWKARATGVGEIKPDLAGGFRSMVSRTRLQVRTFFEVTKKQKPTSVPRMLDVWQSSAPVTELRDPQGQKSP